ncbi:MAG: hypothetical protein WCW26_01675 [Candidatus Buchananbacteria bacterium]
MFLTIHGAAGVLIGEQINNFWLALILGFISHFLIDLIPHGDVELLEDKNDRYHFSQKTVSLLKKITLLDVATMFSFLTIYYWQGLISISWPVLGGLAGSILPDFLQGLYFLTRHPILKRYFKFHSDMHFVLKNLLVSFKTGLAIQFLTLAILIFMLVLAK